jgi:hypothetical protein
MKCQICKQDVKKCAVGAARCNACLKCELCGVQISFQRANPALLCDICVQLHYLAKVHGAGHVQELVRQAVVPGSPGEKFARRGSLTSHSSLNFDSGQAHSPPPYGSPPREGAFPPQFQQGAQPFPPQFQQPHPFPPSPLRGGQTVYISNGDHEGG